MKETMDWRTFSTTCDEYRAIVGDAHISPDIYKDIALAAWKPKGQRHDMLDFLNTIDNYLDRGNRVLDLGCGYGFFSALLAQNGHRVHGLDIATDTHVQMSDRNGSIVASAVDNKQRLQPVWKSLAGRWAVDFALYDGREIPYPDQHFDGVVAIGVLEHVPPAELDAVLSDVVRVLKPGGRFFIFYAPRSRSYAEWLARVLGVGHHDILFEQGKLERVLSKQGFDITRTDVQDLFLRGGLGLQWLLNFFEPLTRMLEKLLMSTPLRAFAHHWMILSQKPAGASIRGQ